MVNSGFRLGIDFGTSNTVAVLRWPDGRAKALLFDGAPLLPSAVYASEDGTILTGRDAVHSARLQPHRFEPYPKRRIDESIVYLGDREIPSVELIATVLRRVATEAYRVANAAPGAVTITHPAAWGGQRRDVLSRAAVAAGLPAPMLVAEPVAAASYFVGTVGTHLPVGGPAVVYDFGAGTFDATVVRRTAAGGFDVLSTEGLTDAGGLDVDSAIVSYLGEQLAGRAPAEWRRLSQPADDGDRRAAWQLWEDARHAKETLSRAATTYVHVPLVDDSVPVGREELERLARPILDRTITATLLAVSSAGLTPAQLSGVFLVGGSSRIPLAATLLHRAFGTAPIAIEQPELVVAEGALGLSPRAGRATVGRPADPVTGPGGAPATGAPMSGPPMSGPPVSGPPMSGPPMSGPPMSGPSMSGPPMSGPPMSGPPMSGGSAGRPGPGAPSYPAPAQHPAGGWGSPAQPGPVPPAPAPHGPAPHGPAPHGPAPHGPVGAGPARGWPADQLPQYPVDRRPRRRSRGPLIGGLAAAAVLLLLIAGGVALALRSADNKRGDDPKPPVAGPACGYKIAYLGILTGDNNGDGETVRNATRFAVERYNNDHADCRVDLVEYDTKGDEDEAARLADQLVKDAKILGVVGPVWSSEAATVLPVLDAGGVTAISPSATETTLTTRGWKTFHRTVASDREQAVAGARYLTTVLRARRVFIVADTDQVSAGLAAEVRLRLNTAAAGRADITGTETDFTPVITQVGAATADAIYFAGYHDAAGAFVKQLRAAGSTAKVITWDRVFTDAYITGAGKEAAEGTVMTCGCLPPSEARNNFANDYRGRYTEAGYYGPEAYDAANALLAAIAAGKATRADVLAHVHGYDAEGVTRRIRFEGSGDLAGSGPTVWAYTVRGGAVYKQQVVATG